MLDFKRDADNIFGHAKGSCNLRVTSSSVLCGYTRWKNIIKRKIITLNSNPQKYGEIKNTLKMFEIKFVGVHPLNY